MGLTSLSNNPNTLRIQNYLRGQGINTLDQISSWEENTNLWKGWTFPLMPPLLENDQKILKEMLHCAAPLNKDCQDSF